MAGGCAVTPLVPDRVNNMPSLTADAPTHYDRVWWTLQCDDR